MAENKENQEKQGNFNGLESLIAFTDATREFAKNLEIEATAVAQRLKESDVEFQLASPLSTLRGQFGKICDYVVDNAVRLSPGQREEVQTMMKYHVGTDMVKSVTTTMQRGLRISFKGILDFINKHMEEIKKIIHFILDTIFGLLGKTVPKWLNALLNFIDEIGHIIFEIIDVLTGGDGESLAVRMHNSELRFIGEMAAIKKLNLIGNSNNNVEE